MGDHKAVKDEVSCPSSAVRAPCRDDTRGVFEVEVDRYSGFPGISMGWRGIFASYSPDNVLMTPPGGSLKEYTLVQFLSN